MQVDPEELAREYFEIKSKINELESLRKEIKNSLFEIFDQKRVNEIISDDIKVYRNYITRISWDEDKLKSILQQKGLWDRVLSPDTKKIKGIIESGLISEIELNNAKITKGSWYTYAKKIKEKKSPYHIKSIKKEDDYSSISSVEKFKTLIITDLVYNGKNKLTAHAMDNDGKSLRLIPTLDFLSENIDSNKNKDIRPFSVVKLKLLHSQIKSHYLEDKLWDNDHSPFFIRKLSQDERKELLDYDCHNSVKDIFNKEIHQKNFIKSNKIEMSIGTIKVSKIDHLDYREINNEHECNLSFIDEENEGYDLSVKDYSFKEYLNILREQGNSPDHITDLIKAKLENKDLYLRIGLQEIGEDIHWLHINSIYSFPYYNEFENL
ncbi:hypothetical protein [Methanobacterium alcaliphilum]|uniref:hypothetical protein n=1 Tax=Methanobacterium alcaliphilum TaxID=392018 RepID=UPI00200B65F5|nr:hypothetical protein [Methanobacterium alcaliphilum]MCK9151821.1 hypothetical protein [Methanobacterium alcaliphilum]